MISLQNYHSSYQENLVFTKNVAIVILHSCTDIMVSTDPDIMRQVQVYDQKKVPCMKQVFFLLWFSAQ